MDTVTLEIDGKRVEAEKGTTILRAARSCGADIPTLCHHDELEPSGVCRLCMVEIERNGRTKLVASCVHEVEEGLVVRTDTERVMKIRRMIIELLWPTVPDLAERYGVTCSRFEPVENECNRCGLCVRYCREVKKIEAVFFKGRGIDRRVAIVPELAAECAYCRECYDLCSGGWIVNRAAEMACGSEASA